MPQSNPRHSHTHTHTQSFCFLHINAYTLTNTYAVFCIVSSSCPFRHIHGKQTFGSPPCPASYMLTYITTHIKHTHERTNARTLTRSHAHTFYSHSWCLCAMRPEEWESAICYKWLQHLCRVCCMLYSVFCFTSVDTHGTHCTGTGYISQCCVVCVVVSEDIVYCMCVCAFVMCASVSSIAAATQFTIFSGVYMYECVLVIRGCHCVKKPKWTMWDRATDKLVVYSLVCTFPITYNTIYANIEADFHIANRNNF